jgi:hypothetical protein
MKLPVSKTFLSEHLKVKLEKEKALAEDKLSINFQKMQKKTLFLESSTKIFYFVHH